MTYSIRDADPVCEPGYHYTSQLTVVHLFEEQVKNNPGAIAVTSAFRQLTYRELNDWSNRLSHYLRVNYQVAADDLVAIKLERSEWLVVAIMGILKSGGAYLPIDTSWPEDRINFVIKDSECKILVDEIELGRFIEQKDKYSGDNFNTGIKPNHLVYCIYTSGSTGLPKGCLIEHGSLVNRLKWMQKAYPLTPGDTILQKTTYAFDVSVWELLWWAIEGAKVYMLEVGGEKDPEQIFNAIVKQGITVMHFVPSMLSAFLEYAEWKKNAGLLTGLKQVFASGEALTVTQTSRFLNIFPGKKLMNLYGPTEATIDVSYFDCSNGALNGIIPIGRPIYNTQLYILGPGNSLVAVGVAGEICIGGIQVGREYLNRPELTAERFIKNPFGNGRLYRTGDQGRWLSDGNIEYLGRIDSQVKIRGHRIELGEIENAFKDISGVNECAAVIKEDNTGEKHIAAYVVCKRNLFNKTEIINQLRKVLPAYMVPSVIVNVESLPVTSNGKLNRGALPDISPDDLLSEQQYVAPQNSIQQYLVKAWEEVLGVSRVGIYDNFFLSGGHSLKAMELKNKIGRDLHVDIDLAEFFNHPLIIDLSEVITSKRLADIKPIPLQPAKSRYPVSSAQAGLWLLSQTQSASQAYNVYSAYHITGQINYARLVKSFNRVIKENEILRTNFNSDEDGSIYQFVRPYGTSGFILEGETIRDTPGSQNEIDKIIREEIDHVFDLENESLVRAKFLRVNNDSSILICTLHHIICDAWSLQLLLKKILNDYNGVIDAGEMKQKAGYTIQYKDYACWQQENLLNSHTELSREYFKSQLNNFPAPLNIPFSFPRPATKKFKGRIAKRIFDAGTYDSLKKLQKQQNVTLFMLLLAGVKALLYRYSGQTDIVLGSPVAGRNHPDLDNQLGFFLNTLFFRSKMNIEDSFLDLLKNIKDNVTNSLAHQDYPFSKIANEPGLITEKNRSPLFDVMLVYLDENLLAPDILYESENLKIKKYETDHFHTTSKFDLLFTFHEKDGKLILSLEYDLDLFNDFLANTIADNTVNFFGKMVSDFEKPISQVSYLTDHELSILNGFNKTHVPYDLDQTIIDLFERSVNAHSQAPALTFKNKSYNYDELNKRVNQFADLLFINYKIRPGSIIGMMLPRSDLSVITMLSILKLGATYVFLDAGMPFERLRHIISDSQVEIAVTGAEFKDVLKQFDYLPVVCPDAIEMDSYSIENPGLKVSNDSASYIIYTSGTTGRPKGVEQAYLTLYNLIKWNISDFNSCGRDKHLQYSSFGFDMSIHDVLLTLTTGGELFVADEDTRYDLARLQQYIIDKGITRISMTHTLLQSLFSEFNSNDFNGHSINTIISAGEQLFITGGLRSFMEEHKEVVLYNYYGPSETHIVTGARFCASDGLLPVKASIGKAIANTQLFLLDHDGLEVPIGIKGEIFIGGMNLAIGYKNNKSLTSQKFISGNTIFAKRFYKTGDWGIYNEHGEIEYCGRTDDQVKINGNRVELEEITQVLLNYAGINNAITILGKPGNDNQFLIAYYTSDIALNIEDINDYLAKRLPRYMLPRNCYRIPAFPFNENGKIDKNALLKGMPVELSIEKDVQQLMSALESKIAEIWKQVLGVDMIKANDDFFDKGGNSLKAMIMVARLNKTFHTNLAISVFFNQPTISGIASYLQMNRKAELPAIPILERKNEYAVSPGQEAILLFDKFHPGEKDTYVIRVSFFINMQLDVNILTASLNYLVRRHEILRTSFSWNDREVFQHVINDVPAVINYEDVSAEKDIEDYIRNKTNIKAQPPFDLSQPPLFRCFLFRMDKDSYRFVFFVHHVIFDGWSAEIFRRELAAVYSSLLSGAAPNLISLPIQYKEYAEWHLGLLDSNLLSGHRKYWNNKLNGVAKPVFTTDFTTRDEREITGGVVESEFNSTQIDFINDLCVSEKVSLFTFLVAIVAIVTREKTDPEKFMIGITSAGRFHESLENQLGYYVNMLPLIIRFDKSHRVKKWLREIAQELAETIDNQVIPFPKILADLSMNDGEENLQLFNVVVNLINIDISNSSGDAAKTIQDSFVADTAAVTEFGAKHELAFHFYKSAGSLNLYITYAENLFRRETAMILSRNIGKVINAIRDDADQNVNALAESLKETYVRKTAKLEFNLDLDD